MKTIYIPNKFNKITNVIFMLIGCNYRSSHLPSFIKTPPLNFIQGRFLTIYHHTKMMNNLGVFRYLDEF